MTDVDKMPTNWALIRILDVFMDQRASDKREPQTPVTVTQPPIVSSTGELVGPAITVKRDTALTYSLSQNAVSPPVATGSPSGNSDGGDEIEASQWSDVEDRRGLAERSRRHSPITVNGTGRPAASIHAAVSGYAPAMFANAPSAGALADVTRAVSGVAGDEGGESRQPSPTWYITGENQSLQQIGSLLDVSVSTLITLNHERFYMLTRNSRFCDGTRILLPTGLKGAVRARMKRRTNSGGNEHVVPKKARSGGTEAHKTKDPSQTASDRVYQQYLGREAWKYLGGLRSTKARAVIDGSG